MRRIQKRRIPPLFSILVLSVILLGLYISPQITATQYDYQYEFPTNLCSTTAPVIELQKDAVYSFNGIRFAFFMNNTRYINYATSQGENWTAGSTAGGYCGFYASVTGGLFAFAFNSENNRVFFIATGTTTNTSLYYRWGTMNVDGSITWGIALTAKIVGHNIASSSFQSKPAFVTETYVYIYVQENAAVTVFLYDSITDTFDDLGGEVGATIFAGGGLSLTTDPVQHIAILGMHDYIGGDIQHRWRYQIANPTGLDNWANVTANPVEVTYFPTTIKGTWSGGGFADGLIIDDWYFEHTPALSAAPYWSGFVAFDWTSLPATTYIYASGIQNIYEFQGSLIGVSYSNYDTTIDRCTVPTGVGYTNPANWSTLKIYDGTSTTYQIPLTMEERTGCFDTFGAVIQPYNDHLRWANYLIGELGVTTTYSTTTTPVNPHFGNDLINGTQAQQWVSNRTIFYKGTSPSPTGIIFTDIYAKIKNSTYPAGQAPVLKLGLYVTPYAGTANLTNPFTRQQMQVFRVENNTLDGVAHVQFSQFIGGGKSYAIALSLDRNVTFMYLGNGTSDPYYIPQEMPTTFYTYSAESWKPYLYGVFEYPSTAVTTYTTTSYITVTGSITHHTTVTHVVTSLQPGTMAEMLPQFIVALLFILLPTTLLAAIMESAWVGGVFGLSIGILLCVFAGILPLWSIVFLALLIIFLIMTRR